MQIRIQIFTLIRIRIHLLIYVMGICSHWSMDLQGSNLSLQASIVGVHGPRTALF